MVRSMTAFAREQGEYEWGTLVWEIRTVNHRYLEPGLRLPEALRALEPQVRDTLRKQLSRGKVECQLRYQLNEQLQSSLSINTTVLAGLLQAAERIREQADKAAPLAVADLLRWPGVLQESDVDVSSIGPQAMHLFKQALASLNAAREREGRELAGFLLQRLDDIDTITAEIRTLMPAILQRQRQLMQTRVAEMQVNLEPGRLEQEVALLAQKCDIDEELDRLQTHVSESRRILNTLSNKEPIGRRLDFLMQELNREANTLSSKSVVTETTLNAVELKVLIEQMREQIQNIE
ncbi:MAG: YicC/YloC family endoribonuclease [Pseudomonadales bacterium]|nr:YicC/YloC family endoribonuclease [Pseudomonadales bacterium]